MNHKELYYHRFIDIWDAMCSAHYQLLQLAQEEYNALLASEIEEIEVLSEQKEVILHEVEALEEYRKHVIEELERDLDVTVTTISDLHNFIEASESEAKHHYFHKYNKLLISVIEELKAQNKKNMRFIGKALRSLEEITRDFQGKEAPLTYDSNGVVK